MPPAGALSMLRILPISVMFHATIKTTAGQAGERNIIGQRGLLIDMNTSTNAGFRPPPSTCRPRPRPICGFCFCKRDLVLDQAVERMRAWLGLLSRTAA